MADETEKMVENMGKVADHVTTAHREAEGLHLSFGKFLAYGAGFKVIEHALEAIVKQSTLYKAISSATSAENLSISKLIERQSLEYAKQREVKDRMKLLGEDETDAGRLKLESLTKQNALTAAQLDLAFEANKINSIQVALLGAIVGLSVDLIGKQRQLNMNLIDANSSYQVRNSLFHTALATQARLGTSFDTSVEAARALVRHGLEMSTTFEENLGLVVKLHTGLGVGVDTAADLAAVVERQVKGSFEGVSKVVAELVDFTAIAGEDAAKLAVNLNRAMSRVGPGGVTSMPDVVRLVGRYESALREVGAMPGSFEALVEKLTSYEGLDMAARLRVNPEFIRTTQGVQGVLDNFHDYIKTFVGNTTGITRQMQLHLLAQQFHTTAQSINEMLIAGERAKAPLDESISLQNRWRQQLNATNQGFERIVNTIGALAQRVLSPFMDIFTGAVNLVAGGLELINSTKTGFYSATAAVGIGMAVVIKSMSSLVMRLWEVVTSTFALTASLRKLAQQQIINTNTNWVTGTGTGSGGAPAPSIPAPAKGITDWVKSLVTNLVRPFQGAWSWAIRGLTSFGVGLNLATGGLVALLSVVAWQLNEGTKRLTALLKLWKEQKEGEKVYYDLGANLLRRSLENVQRQSYLGLADNVLIAAERHFSNMRTEMERENVPIEERSAWMKQWMETQKIAVRDAIYDGLVARGMRGSLTERGKFEVDTDKRVDVATGKLEDLAAKQLKAQQQSLNQQLEVDRSREIMELKRHANRWDLMPAPL